MFNLMKKRRGYLDEAKAAKPAADLETDLEEGGPPPPLPGLGGAEEDLEGEGPEANTPEEHKELADHYQALADFHRAEATKGGETEGEPPPEGGLGEKKPALAIAIGLGKPKETPEEEGAEPLEEEMKETPEEEAAETPEEEKAEEEAGTEIPPKKKGPSKFNLFRKGGNRFA